MGKSHNSGKTLVLKLFKAEMLLLDHVTNEGKGIFSHKGLLQAPVAICRAPQILKC